MIRLSLLATFFALFLSLNNFILWQPAQATIMESISMTSTMPTNASMKGMPDNMSMPGSMSMSGNMSTDMATTMQSMNEMMMMCMADMMKSNKKWYWIGGGVLALILLGVLGWWLWRNRTRFIPNNSPLLILQRRLAQGEITLEQYEAVKVHLSTADGG